jgi:outer membrane protein assembly factor BamB
MRLHLLWILALSFTLHANRAGADWLQFRGPGGLGISTEKNLPTTWSATKNVKWKTELPGAGSSSPIVVGDKIFVTCYSGYGQDNNKTQNEMSALKRHLVCLTRDGKILWTRDVPTALPETNYSSYQALHGYASSTPVSDGKNVFVFFGKSGVFAFDLDGNQLWSASVGTKNHSWGSGTSPILYKELVIINASAESGALVALKKSDGQRAWTAKGNVSQSWNTPLLVDVPGGGTEVVVSQQGKLRGFNPETGVELWNCQGINDYVCPSAIAHAGVIYVIGARAHTAIAVKAGGKGNVTNTHLLWTLKKGSNVTSPVYHEGHLYWSNDSRGTVYCVKADKGTLVYEQRLTPNPDRIYASPLLADGKIYYVSRTNGTYVVAADPQFQLLAHNSLGDASVFNSSPIADAGQLLLRSNRYLYCLAK